MKSCRMKENSSSSSFWDLQASEALSGLSPVSLLAPDLDFDHCCKGGGGEVCVEGEEPKTHKNESQKNDENKHGGFDP